MKIQHLRNASAILTIAEHVLLLDPMFSEPGALPAFKQVGGGRRNPLVPMPPDLEASLAALTGVLITHEHPDHFDAPALAWVRERNLPVWTNAVDAPNLRRKGLDVHELVDGALGMAIEVIPTQHGSGLIGFMMGPVSGCYLAHPAAPSLYITSDAVLTDALLDAVDRLQPDVIVAPAGAANFGIGGDILFSVDELITLIQHAPGEVVLNHLEAIDHCPTTRVELRRRMREAGLSERVHVPEDGETLEFERRSASEHRRPRAAAPRRPGLQKWLTAKFAGT